ncbi:MAG: outer membrane lipoprotein-sorting protein [Aquisalimonadaceae bacterium]
MRRHLIALLLIAAGATAYAAGEDEVKGLEIVTEMDRRESGYLNYRASVTMTLSNREQQVAVREMEYFSHEIDGDGDKTMAVFEQPRDLRRLSVLTYSYKNKPDDQWMFLPAQRRVKRIATTNQSGPFLGSEFAYEDLGSQEIEKFDYRYLRDEPLDGQPCHVVERIPRYAHSGYSRQEVWIDTEAYRIQRIDYYDRGGSLLKTLRHQGYQLYLDRYWQPEYSDMVNLRTGKSTRIQRKDIQFGIELTEQDFTPAALRRQR